MHSIRTNGTTGESIVNDVEDWFAGSSDVAGAVSTAAVSDPSATPVPASSPLHYFIKIDGVKGDATVNGTSGWLAVDGFDWDLKNASTIGSATGGAGAGKASFSPLTIDIHSLAGAAALFKDAATGGEVKSAELVGVQSIKGESLEVYKVDLADVRVGSFQQDPGAKGVETTLGLDFAQLKITDQPTTTNGKLGTPETASWDVITNSATGAVTSSDLVAGAVTSSDVTGAVSTAAVSDPSATPVPASSPLHYFIKIDGVKGDATVNGTSGWLAVDGFDWDLKNASTIGSATGGAGAGKASFSPLTIDIHSLAGAAALFKDAATGGEVKSAELVGVQSIKGESLEVYKVDLADVRVGSFQQDPGAKGVETTLGLDFAQLKITDQPTTANGKLGTPETASWDVITNSATGAVTSSDLVAGAVTSSDVAGAVSTAAVSDPSATPVPASSPLHYFIKIDGVKGDATVNGTSGWLAVDGFDWDLKNASTIGSATGGAGAGKASFSPLTIDIHSLAGAAALFKDAATGGEVKSAELVGVQSIKGESLEVYKVDLADVRVGSFQQDPGAKGVETTLGLDFAQLKITDQPTTTNGKLGTPETASWDVITNSATGAVTSSDLVAGAVTSSDVTGAVSTAAVSDPSATPVPASSPLHYFIKIDGVKGDATVNGTSGWLAVDGFDWDLKNASTIGSATGGAGAGKASFSPLTIDIHSLAGAAALFKDAATGGEVKSAELVGVQSIKGESLEVYKVDLADVRVGSFQQDPGAKGVETTLGLDFAQLKITDQPTTANGKLGTPETASWDVITNSATGAVTSSDLVTGASSDVAGAVSTAAVSDPAATPVPASSPLHYFIKIDGVKGDATVNGTSGWLAVDGFDWDLKNASTIGSATGGAGAGKASFSPLTIDIHSLAGAAALFKDAATGGEVKSAELVGVQSIKGESLEVYKVDLADVRVGSFQQDPGAKGVETTLGLDFAQLKITDQPTTTNGKLGTPETASWDVITNSATGAVTSSDLVTGASSDVAGSVSTAAVSDPAATPVPASSPLHYFIKIDGVKGDATVNGTSGWLAVDGFDWDLKNASTIGSATGGAGAGKASFSPLTIDIHSLAGAAALFKDAATGGEVKSAELVGVQSIKGESLEVYKVDLADVRVGSFQQDPGAKGVETTLGLDFAQLKITDQPTTTNGKLGTPETASWDVTTNSATATLSPSDLLYDPQLHQSPPPIAPGNIGSSGSQDPLHPALVSTST